MFFLPLRFAFCLPPSRREGAVVAVEEEDTTATASVEGGYKMAGRGELFTAEGEDVTGLHLLEWAGWTSSLSLSPASTKYSRGNVQEICSD